MIEISERLLREFSREDVIETLRHEMAHQYVSEVLKRAMIEPPHGPSFQRICEVFGCDPAASSREENMNRKDLGQNEGTIGLIRKLLAHGNCKSVTREESEAFLSKARQLMFQYKIELFQVEKADLDQGRVYVQRPIGPLFMRLPGHYFELGRILSDFYDVRYVQVYHQVMIGSAMELRTGLEIFGEVSSVDVAEYVTHQLLQQAEKLWNIEKLKLAQKNKGNFFFGLLSGFRERLEREKERQESDLPAETNALLIRDQEELDNRYQNAYPNLRMKRWRRLHWADVSFWAGMDKSSELQIRSGLQGTEREALPEETEAA